MELNKREKRISRHARVTAKLKGTAKRPRVAVFKSNRNVFVQFIDDESGKTILSNQIAGAKKAVKGTKTDKATGIGEALVEKAKEKGIKEIVFDRGGFKYHGRIKAIAEALRKGGLKF